METELSTKYKICLRCKEVLPLYQFNKQNGYYASNCKPCHTGLVNEWKRINGERHSNNYFNYITNEYNFIRERINSKFKPSNTLKEHRQVPYLKKGRYLPNVWVPEMTKLEMWEELMLHIQMMKDKFHGSDGRICRICYQPWTYIRSKPKPGSHGVRKINGGSVIKKRFPKNFSIDRFDTRQTYKVGNIIFVCGDCNLAKGNSEEWLWNRCLEIKKELENES